MSRSTNLSELEPGKVYAFEVEKYMSGKPLKEVPGEMAVFVLKDGSQVRVWLNGDGEVEIRKVVVSSPASEVLSVTPRSTNSITIN